MTTPELSLNLPDGLARGGVGGTSYKLIAATAEERIELYSSPALLDELADVLRRAKFTARLECAQRTAIQLIEQCCSIWERRLDSVPAGASELCHHR